MENHIFTAINTPLQLPSIPRKPYDKDHVFAQHIQYLSKYHKT